MKWDKFIKKNPLELVLCVLLIIFILSPIQPPLWIANGIDSTLGIILVSILIVYLFVYSHTILAILFVITVFELIRRSSARKNIKPSIVTFSPLKPSKLEQGDFETAPTLNANGYIARENVGSMSNPQYKNMVQGGDIQRQMIGDQEMMIANPHMDQRSMFVDGQNEFVDYMADQAKRDQEMQAMNTKLMEITLEEQVVSSVPAQSVSKDYLDSSYKPVYDNIHQASIV